MVLLTKTDTLPKDDVRALVADVTRRASWAEIVAVSAFTGEGIADVRSSFLPGETVALLGSSGVGKSTLTNALLETEAMATNSVGAFKERGRHTTTHRQLFRCPGGFLLVDAPGIRELQLDEMRESPRGAGLDAPDAFGLAEDALTLSAATLASGKDDDDPLALVFQDVVSLQRSCRWSDCTHAHEPGCAVREALEAGTLGPERLMGYEKMRRELEYQARRTDARAQAEQKRKWKAIHMEQKRLLKTRGGTGERRVPGGHARVFRPLLGHHAGSRGSLKNALEGVSR